MSLDEHTLQAVAQDGHMEYSTWPDIIGPLLDRLNHIVYNEFPLPRPYPTNSLPLNRSLSISDTPAPLSATTQVSQTPTTPRQLPPVPPFPGSSTSDTSTSQVPNSQPEHILAETNSEQPLPELPIKLLQLLNSITHTLRTAFSAKPPHTIQRLSELILDPKRHYKTLPAWLRAVDRVVSVSSTADIFPLSDTPAIVNGVNGDRGGGILWNNNKTEIRNGGSHGYDSKELDSSLGSDESLGGALLTPIPWLRNITHEDVADDLEGTGAASDGQGVDDYLGGPIQLPSSTSDISAASTSDSGDGLLTPDYSAGEVDIDATTTIPSVIHRTSDPFVPERLSGAVTQGELIRMEQEAGVIPVGPNGVTGASSPPSLHRGGLRSEGPPSSIALGIGVGLAGDPTSLRDGTAMGSDEDDRSGDNWPHARGPDVLGTVDMGLVGGKGVEVRLGSPPDDHQLSAGKVNVNDAQDVLAGGNAAKERDGNEIDAASGTSGDNASLSGEFVHISGTENASDDMQVDNESHSVSNTTAGWEGQHQQNRTKMTEDEDDESNDEKGPGDEDIVLVDADGLTEAQREKVDASALNVGMHTADGTGL